MNELVLLVGLAIIAFLYAMVGHGGASGYITLLTLAGVATTVVRPSALLLNIVVSAMAFVQSLPQGVYVAMNGKYFLWDNVRKNKDSGQFEELS